MLSQHTPTIVTLTIWARRLAEHQRPWQERQALFRHAVGLQHAPTTKTTTKAPAGEHFAQLQGEVTASAPHTAQLLSEAEQAERLLNKLDRWGLGANKEGALACAHGRLLMELARVNPSSMSVEMRIDSGFLVAMLQGLEGTEDGVRNALGVWREALALAECGGAAGAEHQHRALLTHEVRNAMLHACRTSPMVAFSLASCWTARHNWCPDIVGVNSLLHSLSFVSAIEETREIFDFLRRQPWDKAVSSEFSSAKRKALIRRLNNVNKMSPGGEPEQYEQERLRRGTEIGDIVTTAAEALLQVAAGLHLEPTVRTHMAGLEVFRHFKAPEKALALLNSRNLAKGMDTQCLNAVLSALLSLSRNRCDVEGGFADDSCSSTNDEMDPFQFFVDGLDRTRWYYEARRVFERFNAIDNAIVNAVTCRMMLGAVVEFSSEDRAMAMLEECLR